MGEEKAFGQFSVKLTNNKGLNTTLQLEELNFIIKAVKSEKKENEIISTMQKQDGGGVEKEQYKIVWSRKPYRGGGDKESRSNGDRN